MLENEYDANMLRWFLGTWLNSDDGQQNGELSIPSNVTRMSRAIKQVSDDGIPQVVYYHFGVGSEGGMVDRVVMGMHPI